MTRCATLARRANSVWERPDFWRAARSTAPATICSTAAAERGLSIGEWPRLSRQASRKTCAEGRTTTSAPALNDQLPQRRHPNENRGSAHLPSAGNSPRAERCTAAAITNERGCVRRGRCRRDRSGRPMGGWGGARVQRMAVGSAGGCPPRCCWPAPVSRHSGQTQAASRQQRRCSYGRTPRGHLLDLGSGGGYRLSLRPHCADVGRPDRVSNSEWCDDTIGGLARRPDHRGA